MPNNSAISSICPHASGAGADIMEKGGNAVDAAIAAGAVLAVTSQNFCGLGGDLFALVWDDSSPAPAALNASGRSGSGASAQTLRADGLDRIPFHHSPHAVPVPGCVDGWAAMHQRYGSLPWADLFADAINLAENGWPSSKSLEQGATMLEGVDGAEEIRQARAGEKLRRPRTAQALRDIASKGREGFYEGPFGAGLIELGAGLGANGTDLYTAEDLRTQQANWEKALAATTAGHTLWTSRPNSQGYLLSLAMRILDHLEFSREDEGLWAHYIIEACRLAGYDRPEFLHEHADAEKILLEAASRAERIHPDTRADVSGPQADGGTTYMAVSDSQGMAVSYIQSNAAGFGSLLFEPRTGIALQNRGIGFNLTPGHPAEYGPRKRPPHTLLPALVSREDGSLRLVTGTMGGDAQPQIVTQILDRILRGGQSVTQAIGAPRIRLDAGQTGFDTWSNSHGVNLEQDVPTPWETGLRQRGHEVNRLDVIFGHAHAIEITPSGQVSAAADPRAETGTALVFLYCDLHRHRPIAQLATAPTEHGAGSRQRRDGPSSTSPICR
ncbi:gamma-glutamyltransferase family protein [Natronoglycomyces albus]|uniref:Gamma-glutamyltransferase n=1 Tax=Natronoglycomyces albus TaxID=2811108 RepID=A0A895XRT0_9ACTN|nr:gamma-glutamyltransferase [Natronoglycomyces albus]QSB04328.1 gamma-glutamyltransferase [Natronoglycomyces albus]